jgi:ethanolamine utilization protein EutN
MILCRVGEPVVSTVRHPAFATLAVFVVQPLEADGSDAGDSFLAVDHAQAGPGDRVLVLREGSGIRQLLGDATSCVRALIVGVVDAVDVEAGDLAAIADRQAGAGHAA